MPSSSLLLAVLSEPTIFPFAGDFAAQAHHEVKSAAVKLVSSTYCLKSQLQVALLRLSIGLLLSILA